MQKRLGAKVEMWRTVRDLQNEATYAPLIAGVPALATGFTTLSGHISQTESLDVARAGAAATVGSAKSVSRDLLTKTASIVDGILTAQAAGTSDQLLLAQVNKELSDLRGMREEEFRAHCAFLISKVPTPIPAPMANFGMTTALRTALMERYTTFHSLMSLPTAKSAQESTFISLMDAQEDQVDKLLDLTLDKLMRQFIESNPQLHIAYKEARMINDAATNPEEDPAAPTPSAPPVPPGS